jgi:hypothetical protein
MALVNPNIAMSYRPTTEYQPRNALAEYAQIQQIVGGQRQAEMAEMQLEKYRQDRSTLDTIRQAIVAKGGPPDLEAAADAMIKSGNPDYMERGSAIRETLNSQRQWEAYQRQANPAPTSAPGAGAPAPAQLGPNALASAPAAPAQPTNAMAAAQPAAQPTNAMVAAGANRLADLESRYRQVAGINTPGAKAEAQLLRTQIEAALRSEGSRPVAVSPGQVVYDPRTGQQVFAAPAREETPRPMALSPGQILVDPRTGQEVFTAPAAATAPNIDLIGVAKGTDNPVYFDKRTDQQFTIGTDASGKQIRVPYVGSVNRSTSTVTATATAAGAKLEGAEQKGKGELNVKQYGEIAAAARLAQKTLPAIETQARIINNADFTTGFGTDVKKAGASVLAALGVPEAEKFATNAQTFIAATQQAVLQKQLEQKGVQTQADADRITQTGAQLGNTVAANRFIIDVARAQLQRDIAQRNFYDDWWSNKKTYEGAENAWFNGEGGKSLFDRPELKKYLAPAGAAAAPAQPSSVRAQADAILQRK